MDHSAIYETAALYDLAFSYRDFAQEAGFLRQVFTKRRGRSPRSFLELAAGPGRHAQEMSQAGLQTAALDLSPAMAAYCRRQSEQRGLRFPYVVGDMTRFQLEQQFDLIACMLCSATYLTSEEQLLRHLTSVQSALSEQGLYVLELPHPSESTEAKTHSDWSVQAEQGELAVQWNVDAAEAPMLTVEARLEFRFKDGRPAQLVTDTARMRDVAEAELRSLASAAGLVVQDVFGALDEGVALHDPKAWRMVAVLGKPR